MMTTSAVRYLK